MANSVFRRSAALAVGALAVAYAAPASAQHRTNNSGFGGFAASQETQINLGNTTGGGKLIVNPLSTVALPKAGGQFDQGTGVFGGAISKGSQVFVTPETDTGPTTSTLRSGTGGVKVSQETNVGFTAVTSGSFLGVGGTLTVAWPKAGGTAAQSTQVGLGVINGATVQISPVLITGSATTAKMISPSGLNGGPGS